VILWCRHTAFRILAQKFKTENTFLVLWCRASKKNVGKDPLERDAPP
jgi:hypothetical protein